MFCLTFGSSGFCLGFCFSLSLSLYPLITKSTEISLEFTSEFRNTRASWHQLREKPNPGWVQATGRGAGSTICGAPAPCPGCGESPQAQGATWGIRSQAWPPAAPMSSEGSERETDTHRKGGNTGPRRPKVFNGVEAALNQITPRVRPPRVLSAAAGVLPSPWLPTGLFC